MFTPYDEFPQAGYTPLDWTTAERGAEFQYKKMKDISDKLLSEFQYVQPGPATIDNATAVNKRLDKLYQSTAEDMSKPGANLNALWANLQRNKQNTLQEDPDYRTVVDDINFNKAKGKDGVYGLLANDPNFNARVQDWYDEEKGIKQMPVGTYTPAATHYDDIPATDIPTDFDKYFKEVKSNIASSAGTPYQKLSYDDKGNLIGSYMLGDSTKTEYISPEKVKQSLAGMFQDPDVINLHPSLRRLRVLRKKQGQGYTNEDALNDVSNAFIGTFSKETEKPQMHHEGLPGGYYKAFGSGNEKHNELNLYDGWNSAIQDIANKGVASPADNQVTASALGTKLNDKDRIDINLNGTNYLVPNTDMGTPQSDDPDAVRERAMLHMVIPSLGLLNSAIREESTNPANKKKIADGTYTVDEFGVRDNKPVFAVDEAKLQAALEKNRKYKTALENAKALGYDLSNKKVRDEIENKLKENYSNGDKLVNAALTTNDLGDAELSPSQGTQFFMGNDGNMYLSAMAKIQMNDANKDKLEAAAEAGLGTITLEHPEAKSDDKKGNTVFIGKITRKIDKNISDMTAQYLRSFGDKNYADVSNIYAKENAKEAERAKALFVYPKNPEVFRKHVGENIVSKIRTLKDMNKEITYTSNGKTKTTTSTDVANDTQKKYFELMKAYEQLQKTYSTAKSEGADQALVGSYFDQLKDVIGELIDMREKLNVSLNTHFRK